MKRAGHPLDGIPSPFGIRSPFGQRRGVKWSVEQNGACYTINRAPSPPPAPTVGAQTDYFCFEVTP